VVPLYRHDPRFALDPTSKECQIGVFLGESYCRCEPRREMLRTSSPCLNGPETKLFGSYCLSWCAERLVRGRHDIDSMTPIGIRHSPVRSLAGLTKSGNCQFKQSLGLSLSPVALLSVAASSRWSNSILEQFSSSYREAQRHLSNLPKSESVGKNDTVERSPTTS
jgi:hypothetical protein